MLLLQAVLFMYSYTSVPTLDTALSDMACNGSVFKDKVIRRVISFFSLMHKEYYYNKERRNRTVTDGDVKNHIK